MKAKPKLKQWWDEQSEEDRQQWFKVNSQKKSRSGSAREFDCVGYEEEIRKEVGEEKRHRATAIPFAVYFREQKALGIKPNKIKRAWKDMLNDPAYEKEKASNGEWCIYFFTGIVRDSLEKESLSQLQKRRKLCDDAGQLTACLEQGQKQLDSVQKHCARQPAQALRAIDNSEESSDSDSEAVDLNNVAPRNNALAASPSAVASSSSQELMVRHIDEKKAEANKREQALYLAAQKEAAVLSTEEGADAKAEATKAVTLQKVNLRTKFSTAALSLREAVDLKVIDAAAAVEELKKVLAATGDTMEQQKQTLNETVESLEVAKKDAESACADMDKAVPDFRSKLDALSDDSEGGLEKLLNEFNDLAKGFKSCVATYSKAIKTAWKVKKAVDAQVQKLVKASSKSQQNEVQAQAPKKVARLFNTMASVCDMAAEINVVALQAGDGLDKLGGKVGVFKMKAL